MPYLHLSFLFFAFSIATELTIKISIIIFLIKFTPKIYAKQGVSLCFLCELDIKVVILFYSLQLMIQRYLKNVERTQDLTVILFDHTFFCISLVCERVQKKD